ncbi:hypothetical protein Peur_033661 [Populus x canadensis]
MAGRLILTQSVLVAGICKATSCCEAFEKQSRMFFYGSRGGVRLFIARLWEISKVFIFRGVDNWINGLDALVWYANDVVLNELLGAPSSNYVTPYG